MKIAFITRSTLYSVPGGDTIQVSKTVKFLRKLGVEVDICLTNEKVHYNKYDLFHFTNITRPADILSHTSKTKKPYVVSPVLVDYSEYDKLNRKGISGYIFRLLPVNKHEYVKAVARWISGKDKMISKSFLLNGQHKSIKQILQKASLLLPNSEAEYKKLENKYGIKKDFRVVYNGIDKEFFHLSEKCKKDETLVICAARIEGIKNQLNLIKALNNSRYTLLLIGSPSPNQRSYYQLCRKIAAKNIIFREHIPQPELINYYTKAKVHALPSWFETCGLSSLEAVAMGCNITISERGFTREYFGDHAFYCDPADPESIFESIDKAAKSKSNKDLQEKILHSYTWERAAATTFEVYKKIISA